jgi:hypothetical protein
VTEAKTPSSAVADSAPASPDAAATEPAGPAAAAAPSASTPAPVAPPALSGPSRVAAGAAPPIVGSETSDATQSAGPAPPPRSLIAAILTSGAPAALMDLTSPSGAMPSRLALSTSTRRAFARDARSGADPAPTKPSHTGGGGGKGPAPSGPPGSSAAGAGGAAPGGLSSAPLSDVILVLLALVAGGLRRHRLRPTLSAPSGFTPLLQRPG